MALVAQARPADQGGNPLPGGTVRYVATSPAEERASPSQPTARLGRAGRNVPHRSTRKRIAPLVGR
eukprot:9138210-Alexandrium_andersonii.AAC.1